MFNLVQDLLRRCGLDLKKLVAIATDGAPCITSLHQSVVVRLCVLVLHLVGTHCIAHKEALAAKDATRISYSWILLIRLQIRYDYIQFIG